MAVQVSYPGVYIEEFAPGAPIEGVGTNTAAFIGTAKSGPIKKPTLIQSWDAFVATFGGFITEPPINYLAPAVYGFFLNGGTACYVVRAGTGTMASANLPNRGGGGAPDPVITVRALQEGPAGEAISVQVKESSTLTDALAKSGSADTTLAVNAAQATISAISADRTELTVDDNKNFAPGDQIILEKGADKVKVTLSAKQGTTKIILASPIPGAVDYTGGKARTPDLAKGQQSFRVTVPNNLPISRVLPRGTSISITLGGTSEIRTVDSAGGDVITLTEGLANAYSLATPGTLPQIASLEFDLIINLGGTENEKFEFLATNPTNPSYWETVIPKLVALEAPPAPKNPLPADLRPVAGVYALQNGTADDRGGAETDIGNNPNGYLDLLKPIDEVALVSIPGFTDKVVQQAIIGHCQALKNRFAILDSKFGAQPGNGIRDQFADVRSQLGFAALYYPWIQVRNPLTGKNEFWPPSGHVTGVFARTDEERGVHKAPANANIRGALGLELSLTNEQQGPLNLMGINVLRVFPGQSQPMVWGARTTATDRNWQYVNVRRLFLYLEESIQEGINWAIFEPNNLALWQKLKRSISEFLTRVWRDGALFGAKADEAFYVRIDEALNPPSTQALGRLYIEIGVRLTYPAEFIIVRIGIWQGGSDVSEG
jgi:phage tail sheath protein FI